MSKVPEMPDGLPATPIIQAVLDATGSSPAIVALLKRKVEEEAAGGGGGGEYDEVYG